MSTTKSMIIEDYVGESIKNIFVVLEYSFEKDLIDESNKEEWFFDYNIMSMSIVNGKSFKLIKESDIENPKEVKSKIEENLKEELYNYVKNSKY